MHQYSNFNSCIPNKSKYNIPTSILSWNFMVPISVWTYLVAINCRWFKKKTNWFPFYFYFVAGLLSKSIRMVQGTIFSGYMPTCIPNDLPIRWLSQRQIFFPILLNIIYSVGWKKSCTTKMIVESWNPLNSGMFTTYQLEFLPSTASFASGAAGRISACKLQFFIIVRRCSKTCPSLVKRDYLVGGLEHFSIYWEESSQLTFIFSAG